MHTTEIDSPIRQKPGQTPTWGARAGIVTPGRCRCWLRRLCRWYAGCLLVGRRPRPLPRLQHVGDAHHKPVQPSARADCLDQLTQERPTLRIEIYTSLWR